MLRNVYWVVLLLLVITLPKQLYLNALLPFIAIFTVIGYLDHRFSDKPVVSSNLLGGVIYELGNNMWFVMGSASIIYFVYTGSLM